MGALSPLDPLYKEKLRYALKKKGFSYKIIDKAMELTGVDSQVQQAQLQQSKAKFLQALKSGDYAAAGAELATMTSLDKTQGAMMASYYPTFKDEWNVNVKRQDAATNFGYNRALNDDKFKQNVQLKGLDYQNKVNAMMAEYKMKNAAEQDMINYRIGLAMEAGVNDPMSLLTYGLGRGGGSSSGGGSGSGSGSGTSAEGKAGALYRSLYNDANEMMLTGPNPTEGEIQQAALNAENSIKALEDKVKDDIDNGKITDEEDKADARNKIYALRYRQQKMLGNEEEAAGWYKQMTPEYREKMFPDTRMWTDEDQKAKDEAAQAAEKKARDESSKGRGGNWHDPGGYGSYLSQYGRY